MRLLALVLAALATTSAPAKPTAQLLVTSLDTRPGVAAETDVDLMLAVPTTSAEVYVPPGYTIDLGARPGTVIGTTRASTLVAVAPAVWRAAGLTITVDRTGDGGYRLECRLARPTREIDVDIQRGLTDPPAGIVTWRAFVGSDEVRSVVAFPQTLTIRAILSRGVLTATGRLLFADDPRPGVNVHLAVTTRDDFADARELGTARTDNEGRFRLRITKVAARRLLLIAYVNFYVGACTGCLSESIAPPPSQVVALEAG